MNIVKPVAIWASLEWGLKVIAFGPRSFQAVTEDGEILVISCLIQDHVDSSLIIPKFNNSYLVICIPNKEGDNCVLLTRDDCINHFNQKVTFKWVAKTLRKKFRIGISMT